MLVLKKIYICIDIYTSRIICIHPRHSEHTHSKDIPRHTQTYSRPHPPSLHLLLPLPLPLPLLLLPLKIHYLHFHIHTKENKILKIIKFIKKTNRERKYIVWQTYYMIKPLHLYKYLFIYPIYSCHHILNQHLYIYIPVCIHHFFNF